MKRINRISLSVILLSFLFISTTYSQESDPELNGLISDYKVKMKALGYKFIKHTEGNILGPKEMLEFNQRHFIYGQQYIVVSFFKKCENCHLSVLFWNNKTGNFDDLSVETVFNESSYNISECKINENHNTFLYTNFSEIKVWESGYINMYVNDYKSHYISSMLFYK